LSSESPQQPGARFALLYHLSQTFNSSLDLDEVLDRVIDEVIEATHAERGFITLRGDDGSLEFRTARGIEQKIIEQPQFEVSRGVVEEVAQSGEGVLTSDAQVDDRFSGRQSIMALGLRSILCAPMKLKEEILGVIYVDNRLQAGIFTQADLELLTAIGSSAATAIENARLYQVAVEKGRMERELQMAYRVQSGLLPKTTPQFPNWDFETYWEPAREVAGDYYDFIDLEDQGLGLIIADVTDKGMPAALFMALSRSIVRASLDQAISPAAGITRANRLICADSSTSMPITLFYIQCLPSVDEIVYVNAGHNPPLFYNAAEDVFTELTRTGMFLGFDEEASYKQRTQSVNPGDFLVLYTDGVTDAMNPDRQTFGLERFRRVIQEHRNESSKEIMTAIKNAIQAFSQGMARYDDITLLIAKRT
jgi:sigma-B regulation protein RsbU (phosphoserine phosphatase)